MIESIKRETIVEMLLNSLEAERYVRAPLLLEVVDELSGTERFKIACDLAKRMLGTLEAGVMTDSEFKRGLDELRVCVRRSAVARTSVAPPRNQNAA